jgi:hypothetical protein
MISVLEQFGQLPLTRRGSCSIYNQSTISEPEGRYRPEKEADRVLVAAESIDQALQLMLRTYGDVNISKAESLDMIALLSGSPLD